MFVVTKSATAKTSESTSKPALARSKTDAGSKKTIKKPTTKSTTGTKDPDNVPSYMRPTRSSIAQHQPAGSMYANPYYSLRHIWVYFIQPFFSYAYSRYIVSMVCLQRC